MNKSKGGKLTGTESRRKSHSTRLPADHQRRPTENVMLAICHTFGGCTSAGCETHPSDTRFTWAWWRARLEFGCKHRALCVLCKNQIANVAKKAI